MKKLLLSFLFMSLTLPWISRVQAQCTDNASMCAITINVTDSYEDGWDGSQLKIYQRDSLINTVTLANGSSNSVSMQVCPEPISLEWHPQGSFNDECGFEIINIEGIVIYSMAFQSLGNSFTDLGSVNVTCPSCFRPQSFVSTAFTASSASLQWNGSTSSNATYEIAYAPMGFSPNSLVLSNVRTISSLSTTSVTINNLSSDTIYDFYIRTDCGEGEYSNWVGPLTIHPGSYNMAISGHDTITSCGLVIYDDGGIMNDYSGNCNASLTVYPSTPNSLVVVSGTLVAQRNYDKLIFYDGSSTSALEIATYVGNNETPVIIPQISSTTGPITIKFSTNYSTAYSGFELHTSCVDMPTCAPIDNINLVNITGSSAMVEWTIVNNLGNRPSLYELELIDSITNTVVRTDVTSESHFLYSNLSPLTKYIVKVRSSCDNGDNSPWSSENFETKCLVGGDINITNGTNYSSRIPVNFARGYTYTQQIYDATDLDGPANITGISFCLSMDNTISQNRSLTIYLGNTTQSTFASTNEYIPLDSLKLVYSGGHNVTSDWNTIIFDSTFVYDGTSNLVVAVYDNSGFSLSARSFKAHAISSKSIYFESNTHDPNPIYALESYLGDKGMVNFRNDVKFIIPCETNVTCVRPDVYVSNINGNEIEVVWAPGYNETEWDVEYKKTTETEWTLDISGTTLTSHTIYNLDYSTTYEIRVSSICGNESKSYTVSARTDCGNISELPFMETFDTWTAGNNVALDPCWNRISYSVGTSFTYPNVVTSQSLSRSNSIQMSANASNFSALILPPFSFDINTLKVSFSMLKTVTTQHGLQVGVITDPTDVSTFTSLTTIDNSTNNTWENFEISLESYTGTTGYIAMLLPNTTSGSALRYIDNVSVNNLYTSCDAIGGIAVNNITSGSATISWIDSIPSVYGVEYGLRGFAVGTGTFDTTSNTTYTITNLNSLSEYDVYVYRICSEGDTSDASIVTSFTTPCGEITVFPFIENFDTWETNINSFDICWNRLSSSSSVTIYANVSSANSNSQPNSLFMKCQGSNYSIVALPKMGVSLDSLQISFDIKKVNTDSQNIEIGVMTDPTNAATFTTVGTATMASTNVWEGVQVKFDSYTGATGNIAIRIPSGEYISYYIDNIVVDYIPACLAPNDIVMNGFAENGINVDWTEQGSATQWDICYGPDGFDVNGNQARIITGITSHPYTIQNLSSDTIYNVYVRSVCGAGNVSDWSVSHLTSRASIFNLPLHGNDTIYACSARIYDDGGVSSIYSNNANGCVTIYPSSTGNVLNISGSIEIEEQADFIKIFDGPDTTSTRLVYVSGRTSINCTSSYGPITIKFVSNGGVNYSGFDLNVQCVEVSCFMVQDVEATDITSTTATISWTEMGSATQWEIEYGARGFAHGNGNTAIANTTSYTITNLEPSTQYDVYVRAICGANDASQWRQLRITTTLCDNPTVANIGNGTRGEYQIPFYPHYAYSYSQQIFTAEEMGMNTGSSAILSSLSLQYSHEQAINRNISIYLGHIADSVFASGSAWLRDTNLQLVYSGLIEWNNSEPGNWVEIMFNSTFTYNGTDNIVVAIADNTGSDISSYQTNRFYTHTANGNKTIYSYNDNNAANISSPSSGTLSSYRNNIIFSSCESVCEQPNTLDVVTDRTAATLTWDMVGNFEVSYKKTSSNNWSAEIEVLNANTYTVENILPETSYDFRVRKICDSITYSDWVAVRDTTLAYPCSTPTGVQISDITYTSANILWETTGEAHGWRIAYGYGTDDATWDTIVVETSPVTLSNLYPSNQYTVYVQRICDINIGIYSDWTEAYTFSTTACETPSNVAVSNVTNSSAVVTWTSSAQKWEISYGMEGVNEENGTKVTVEGTTSYTIEGLDYETTYDVYVRTICEDGVYSAWTPRTQFTTDGIGINTAATDNVDVRIYPNPANNEAIVTVDGINGKVEFVVADINGRMIATETITCEGSLVKTIDVSNLAKGAYFVHIYNDNFNTTRKLIVK